MFICMVHVLNIQRSSFLVFSPEENFRALFAVCASVNKGNQNFFLPREVCPPPLLERSVPGDTGILCPRPTMYSILFEVRTPRSVHLCTFMWFLFASPTSSFRYAIQHARGGKYRLSKRPQRTFPESVGRVCQFPFLA